MFKPLLIIAIVIGGYLYSNKSAATRSDDPEAVSITGADGSPMKME